MALAWALQTPLTPSPALDQGKPAAQKESSSFQPIPAAIEKLHKEALAADGRGERQKALAMQQEVMAWVKANLPAVHPFRAKALNNLGIYLSGMGQRSEALPPTLEAVKIRRELARTNPAFLPDLAASLNNLGNRYSELGQRSEALPPTLEAEKIYRELARTNPAFLPDLAMALNNLGFFYTQLEKRSEALPLLEEAVQLYIRLVATYPARFQEDLQRARNNLDDLKRQQDLASGAKRQVAPDDRSYLNPSDPDTPLRRSVVRLWPTFAGKKNGIGPLLGTGFVVRRQGDRAWIATARHVVLDPNTNAPPTKLEAELYSGSFPANANLLTARLSVVLPTAAQSDASSGDDLILLEIRGLPADIAALPLVNDPPPDILKVVGHPNNKPWLVVSARLVKDLFDPDGKLFRLKGELSEGASGAPVVDSEGRVVGLVRSRTQIDEVFVVSAYRTGAIQAKMVQTVPAGDGSRSTP
jgi:tetratricopeptide (TPR) repeat protein